MDRSYELKRRIKTIKIIIETNRETLKELELDSQRLIAQIAQKQLENWRIARLAADDYASVYDANERELKEYNKKLDLLEDKIMLFHDVIEEDEAWLIELQKDFIRECETSHE